MDRRRQRLWWVVLGGRPESDASVQALCHGCVAVLESVDAAAVTLRSESRAQELHGASDDWVADLEQAQYTLGEGPGVEAFTVGGPVLVDDLVDDVAGYRSRWPAFAEAAERAGVGAVYAFPLQAGTIRFGTLNLYRHEPGRLRASEAADAAVLADLATTVLLRQFSAAQEAGQDGPRPLTSYHDVNVASGVLAAELGVSLDDAFTRLRAHAYSEGRSVLDVARDVVGRRLDLRQLSE